MGMDHEEAVFSRELREFLDPPADDVRVLEEHLFTHSVDEVVVGIVCETELGPIEHHKPIPRCRPGLAVTLQQALDLVFKGAGTPSLSRSVRGLSGLRWSVITTPS